MDPILSTDIHPTRDSLNRLPATSIHRQAYELAKLVNTIPQDPSLNSKPKGIVVGSFPLQPEQANDLDFEIQGVTWEKLQEFFSDKAARAGIESVVLTKGGDDGIIDPQKPGQRGNAFVAVWLTMDGGRKVNLSIPLKVTSETSRYDLNSVERCPDLPFEQAVLRRNFAHRAVGFDPLVEPKGQILDPLRAAALIDRNELKFLNPDSYRNDPLGLYQAIREIATLEMKPDSETRNFLVEMAGSPMPTGVEAVQENRLNYERALFLIGSAKPSACLNLLIEVGLDQRDFGELNKLKQATSELKLNADWEQALANVDAAWISAKDQQGWRPKDILLVVASSLVHELSQVATNNQCEINWKNLILPFLSATIVEPTTAFTEIESRLTMMQS